MLEEYKTVYEGGENEIIEKKSRFICTVKPVHSEEEAIEFIESMRKKYWNATHNCFAYVLGEHYEVQRCSDDGEPSGTAGKPMLDVLLGEEIHDTVLVVTRYFGGTLLGTGGLVRAYQGAAKAGLQASNVITRYAGSVYRIRTDYTGLGRIQYILGQRKLAVQDTIYTENVEIHVLIPNTDEKEALKEIVEATNGQADIEKGNDCYFATIDKEVITFPIEE